MIGYSQYVKEKTKARSRKKAVSDVFADLKAYDYSYISIQDAYGFDAISNNERERLLTLLDAYEDSKKDKGDKFSDEVTEIMDAAIGIIDDMLDEFFMKEAINDVEMSDTEKVIEEEYNEYLRKAQEE